MDQSKLQRLRDRYNDGNVFDSDDPVLARVARQVQSPDGRRVEPYAGVPTFLSLPYVSSISGLDVAAIGVPMDLGVTNRPGARFGPRAVRTIERIGPYHHALNVAPGVNRRIADVGDVPMRSRYSLDQSIEDIAAFYQRVYRAGVRPVSVGGDHSVSFP